MFRSLLSFSGGITPKENKQWTESLPIETPPVPKMVIIHLSQHTGVPSVPIVSPGDKVKKGQKIGEAGGKISVPTHSSISGVVKEIKEFLHPVTRKRSLAAVIESDGEDSPFENDFSHLTPLKIIEEAGIVGLGGAGFPTHIKLAPPKPVNTLIINGCECEPYLTGDARVMVEYPSLVLEGAIIMAEILKANSLIIAIESSKKEAIRRMREVIGGKAQLVVTEKKYPMGSEKQLVAACLKREIPAGKLPYEIGVSVQNCQTALAVHNAVRENKPLLERVITCSGDGIKQPKNLRVRIGTPIRDIIEYCGGYNGEVKRIILGGPLMGKALFSPSLPIIKTTTGILLFRTLSEEEERECIRCARCVSVCPMRLLPTVLYHQIIKRDWEGAKREGVEDCIECGSCAYACPAKIRLVESFRIAKTRVFNEDKGKKS